MRSRSRTWLVLLVLVSLGTIVAIVRSRSGREQRSAEAPAAASSAAVPGAGEGAAAGPATASDAAAPIAPAATRATPQKGARTLLPPPPSARPPAAGAPAAAASGDAGPSPRARLAKSGPIKDRRGLPPSEATEALRAEVEARLDMVHEDVEACLRDWSAFDPSIEGEVAIAFGIDAQGLTQVWIQDHADVPPGPLSCFASAVYGVDWSAITEQPIEITHRFEYRPESDAGAP
jgi:hypothetical protein